MKSRPFQSKFYSDPYVASLSLKEKAVYTYYLFNEKVNWIGTYETSDRFVLFELGSGITQKELQDIKDKFQRDEKIYFEGGWVVIKNSEKHDTHLKNEQLMKSAVKQLNELPDNIKSIFGAFKPKEVVDIYSQFVGYELPTCRLRVDEGEGQRQREGERQLIINNKKELLSEEEKELIINGLVEKGADRDFVSNEITKFINYWTETNKSGTKQRWELQPTFEVKKRLANWFSNIKNFNKNQPMKGKNYDE